MHSFDSLLCTRRTTEAICSLPAVANLDWFDRAAAALCDASPGAACVILLIEIDATGRIVMHHAVGACAAPPPAPELLDSVRARARRISETGFDPAALGPDRVAPLQALDPAWREKQTGRVWSGLDRPEVLCALHPVPAGAATLLTFLATAAPDVEAAPVLAAVLPALAERASRCVGAAIANPAAWISAREQEVLNQLALGLSVREIATLLEKSPHTVHDHVKSLHRKLGATTRGGLIARATGYALAAEATSQIEPKPGTTPIAIPPDAS